MKTLVVYDSVFGNTEKIAFKIGEGVGEDSKVIKVTDFSPSDLSGVECLFVGSPTRGFRPTKEITGFLNELKAGSLTGVKIAAFDTRIAPEDVNNMVLSFMVKLFGYADKPIQDKLVKKGGELAVDSTGYIVKDSEGPLKDGELERAVDWGKRIFGS